jgi:hypothetical protein
VQNIFVKATKSIPEPGNHIKDVLGVKVTTSGFNFRADSESKRHIHMGPIRKGSGVMSF